MPVAEAIEQLETQLLKARKDLAQWEAAKGRIWQEVAEEKERAAQELATLRQQTEQEKARIVADLPALRQQESAAKHSLAIVKAELVETKRTTDALVDAARLAQRQAEAAAAKAVADANSKLDTIKRQFHEFVRSLPTAL